MNENVNYPFPQQGQDQQPASQPLVETERIKTYFPQQTQIYKGIQDLMTIVTDKYDKAPKKMRNLVFPTLWNALVGMSGNFCMAFVSKDKDVKLDYLGKLKIGYFEVEAMFRSLVECKVITPGHMGFISKSILLPLIKQINALISKV